jgi:hypothetical protein
MEIELRKKIMDLLFAFKCLAWRSSKSSKRVDKYMIYEEEEEEEEEEEKVAQNAKKDAEDKH